MQSDKLQKIVTSLGVTVDNKLSFELHLNLVCKKVSQELHALARVSRFIPKKKLRAIMKAFIMSLFSYCPLVWICHSRTLNNNIKGHYNLPMIIGSQHLKNSLT